MSDEPRITQQLFTASQWWRLCSLYGFIAILHALGWGLYLHHVANFPSLLGLGVVAYLLGLRHAFGADHIAAVDDTVRFMLQKGKQPLGVGFFFSLGHSTVVLVLAIAVALSAAAVKRELPQLQSMGTLIGTSVSGVFLCLMGILNLFVLLDILKVWERTRGRAHNHAHLDKLLAQRGLFNRLSRGRLQRLMNHSWQMYPLGLLFGLGLDTACEIGLLAMTAGAATGDLPLSAVLSLPILFAAGMSLMDTTDGVLMVKAYNWAFLNPVRKIFYNVATTGLSVVFALVIGSAELLQAAVIASDARGPFADAVRTLDFGNLGYFIVGVFLLGWGLSVARARQNFAMTAARIVRGSAG